MNLQYRRYIGRNGGRGVQLRVGTSVVYGQCSNPVGCIGTRRSVVNDTGLRENLIVDFPVVAVQTTDGTCRSVGK